ncbi:hypothetical protein BS47DRAFT_1330368 [Hydnum rufescens UP504]|uniref:FAD-binding FR-type domain-containing protein n=1 Tax=Hydnum rufescens UP504 TaxID=1448309 RepID=A0A9P6DV64_9AGAM|nr:hypothetical protein BS47DRAFT_1330368 [Hydnum rufescens UP504]
MASFSNTSHSSGIDFHDRYITPIGFHPDVIATTGSNLQRNKTERTRLQGLMRTGSATDRIGSPNSTTMGWKAKYQAWMVNEGGKKIFFSVFILLHLLVLGLSFLNYDLNDNLVKARRTFGVTYPIARAAALVLHVDAVFILLPVCRNFISLLRRTPLNDIIPFDSNLTFHMAVAWSIVFFTLVHVVSHMVNFSKLAISLANPPTASNIITQFLVANFTTGPGATGWIMTTSLGVMVWFALEKNRRKPNGGFEKFWYTHHLFIVLFINWQLHGMFCMIKPDRPPYCSYNNIGVFWRYWLVGGVIFVYERILREVRSRHRTYISKVILHPSNIMEVQIKKEKTKIRAGQYIFLSCPEVSYFQWHPFTLTSAPEEDYISVHIRILGDFTAAFARALGCDVSNEKGNKDDSSERGSVGSQVVAPPLHRVLPRVMVDGPFGTASEDFFKFETILLIGAGIGVTPFASILKSIWYRLNRLNGTEKPTRLSKVYFIWVIRDFGTAEWFHSLLHAIEEQNVDNQIEVSIYLTATIREDDMNNILVQDVGAERDAITSLRAPTHFGRPNWDRTFSGIVGRHPDTDVGVFFCGPAPLSQTLRAMSNKYTTPKGTRFFFGKENF